MQKFGVDGIYTPEQPILSARGALVTNIAHIPAALTAVMRENGIKPDFAPQGNLALKDDVNALEQSSGGPEGLSKCGLFK